MIDIHNHLLPGIDDGCVDMGCTKSQLRILAEAGVKKIYFTPHYMVPHYHNSRKKIMPLIRKIRAELATEDINIDLEAGAEYFLDVHAAGTVKENDLTLGDTQYVLVETMMQKMSSDFYDNTYDLQKAGYKVILAHPERYMDIIQSPETAEDFIHHDIYLQVNAGSLLGYYGKHIEKTAYYLLNKGLVHFIGSDNHGNHDESFQRVVFEMLKENYSEEIAELLLVRNPEAIGTGEKIELFNNWRFAHEDNSIWKNIKEFFTGHE